MAPYPDDINCDLDRPAPRPENVRASDLLIGTAALLPVALKIGLEMKKEAQKRREKNHAA